MGFTIVNSIDVSDGCGVYLDNTYATIAGQFRMERRNDLYNGDIKYYLCTSCSIYRDKNAYDNRKNPILVNIYIDKLIDAVIGDYYRIAYDALKERVKEIFNNQNLTFIDN